MINNCQLLLQNISEGVLMLDEDGCIRFANNAALKLTGYSSADVMGRYLNLVFFVGDDTKTGYELALTKSKGNHVLETWLYTANDMQIWAELSLSPMRNEQNIFVGYSCLFKDVSEKKRNELELMHSEERYRLMVEGIRDYAIIMLDPKGNILTWNDGAKRTKGYLPNEIIGKHFSQFYRQEDKDIRKPERELEIAIATGKYEEEGWRVKKNGSVFWASVAITALHNRNKLIGFSKVTRDLTERKISEEALQQSEERYRSLVEQVLDYGIFLMDEKGIIISWNEGARNIKGYTADEIIGKHFSIFYPEEELLNNKPERELTIAKKEGTYEEEGWRLKKDGSRFWASILITSVYNNEGVLIGFSKVSRDLTERKEAERALRDSYISVQQLAQNLKEKNTLLSDANQELEQFTSVASHDLQEPLRTISSYMQLIKLKAEQGLYDELPIYINKSVTASKRMRELIQNLLNYSQVGKADLKKERVSVENVIARAIQNVGTTAKIRDAEIQVENELDTVDGDSIQLTQLIQNILSNAIKFTEDTPVIKISCNYDDSGIATFSIKDNGIGINGSDTDKVFEIFRRLNTEQDYPGTGIGLAICKKIVERHGGKIWLKSQPGVGTTFYFTLNEALTIAPDEKV